MSDNLRRYRAIREALRQGYPGQPTGLVARHLTTLAALISGIVGSQSTQLPKVATHVPDGAKPESRVKRFARWVDNAHITAERSFVPVWSKYSNVAFSKAFHPALALSQWCKQSTIFMGAARALPLEMLGWRGRLQGFR